MLVKMLGAGDRVMELDGHTPFVAGVVSLFLPLSFVSIGTKTLVEGVSLVDNLASFASGNLLLAGLLTLELSRKHVACSELQKEREREREREIEIYTKAKLFSYRLCDLFEGLIS